MNRWFYILLSAFFALPVSAQVSVEARLYEPSILIGEAVKLDLTATLSEGDSIQWPAVQDTITQQIEILSVSGPDTLPESQESHGQLTIKKQLVITSFDTGFWAIPPFTFTVNGKTYQTHPILLEVKDVEVDTTAEIKDIVAPIEVPMTCAEWIKKYWIYGVYAWLAVMILAVIAYFIGKDRTTVVKPKEPALPIHILALRELDKLKSEELWQHDKMKEYHVRLSEIMREYIEKQFGIPALESTTGEIKQLLKGLVDKDLYRKVIQVLYLSDMAKFAKVKPLPAENEMAIEVAYELVNRTKPDLHDSETEKETER